MGKHHTRVIQRGAFWKVQILNYGVWQTMQDNYLTRADARQHRDYWAQR